MKNKFSLFAFIFLTISLYGQTDAVDRFFKDYQTNTDFSVVSISPKMFQMINKAVEGSSDAEVQDVVKDLKGLKILSTKVKPEQIYIESNKRINVKEYEELLTVKDKGSNVRFVTRESNGEINELLLIVGSKDDFTLMSFVGKIDLNKLSKLAKKLDIQGAEHLDKINKK